MNVTVNGIVYRVDTEREVLLLISALDMLGAFASVRAA